MSRLTPSQRIERPVRQLFCDDRQVFVQKKKKRKKNVDSRNTTTPDQFFARQIRKKGQVKVSGLTQSRKSHASKVQDLIAQRLALKSGGKERCKIRVGSSVYARKCKIAD